MTIDLFMGLPVHALVVHAVVVLLPLAALGLIAIVLVPRWRPTFGWIVMAGLVIGTVSAFIAKQSGQALADRVGLPQDHSNLGDKLPWLCLALLVVSAAWFWMQRRTASADRTPRALTVLGGLSILLALASIALTIAAGHTGALAVWEGRIPSSESTSTPAPAATARPEATASPAASGSGISMADVATHSTAADCWAAINGTVYDLTSWISQHPGGAAVIESLCGTDASAAFTTQHEGQAEPAEELQGFEIGVLS